MIIYFVSGLGADERVFQFLELPGVKKCYIKWIKPLKSETLESYCKRLLSQFDLEKEVILVGVSFGGIICQELAKLIVCKKIMIISSIKSKQEMSPQMKAVGFAGLYKLIPNWFLKWLNLMTASYYFGTKTKEETLLLKQIIKDTDFDFSRWAIEAIMNWDNKIITKNLIHINGLDDLIFPAKFINNAVLIPGGTHFMIVNEAKKLSDLIINEIRT